MRAEVLRIPDTVADSPVISAEALVFRAGRDWRLDIPALTLGGRAPVLILGPNGAGKSLLLRLLHGLLQPTSGTVSVSTPRQAMVFQRPVILRRSDAGTADIALRRQGLDRATRAARAAALLDLGDLADRARQPARTLSFGEQQRLALVRALATDPEILFLDEPTSSLDPTATLALERLIGRVAALGTKIVMVTHDIGQARRLAAEIVFLDRGRLAEHGPARRFFERPDSEPARIYLAGGLIT
jgi:tungstate transport system ATP-binding protein